MVIVGLVQGGSQGLTLIGGGMALAIVAGLDTSIREHFAGYHEHSSLLAGFPATCALGIGFFFLREPWGQATTLIVGLVLFVVLHLVLAKQFRNRATDSDKSRVDRYER